MVAIRLQILLMGTCRLCFSWSAVVPIHRQLICLITLEFKLAILIYNVLNDLSPQYLAHNYQLTTTTNCQQPRHTGGSKNSHESEQQIFYCCSLEQLTSPPM